MINCRGNYVVDIAKDMVVFQKKCISLGYVLHVKFVFGREAGIFTVGLTAF